MYAFPQEEFDGQEYIQTSTGNIISRSASIYKPQSVEIPNGKVVVKPGVVIRGDLCSVQINKFTVVCENTVIRPPYGVVSETFRYIPLTIGSHCYVGPDCVIEAAAIGMGCRIGRNCILSKRCILKDYVTVEDDSIVPVDMVIPPFSIVAGRPARIIGENFESSPTLVPAEAQARYAALQPSTKRK